MPTEAGYDQKEGKVAEFKYQQLTQEQQDKLDAAAFRRLLAHLDANKEVQNIDLMILAGFCRNCFSKWYLAEAQSLQLDISLDDARERVYGMSYDEWKANHQPPATPEQLAAFERNSRKRKTCPPVCGHVSFQLSLTRNHAGQQRGSTQPSRSMIASCSKYGVISPILCSTHCGL